MTSEKVRRSVSEAKLAAIDALHHAEYVEDDYEDESGWNRCANDEDVWPCATPLILHPECDNVWCLHV